jgi:two-component system sensor histidine kinase ChiS
MGSDPSEPEPSAVLVVEDDPAQRRVLTRLLRIWGYATLEAADGGQAVEVFDADQDTLGLVLLDIMLPVLSGLEVAEHVRQVRPDLPIVACSAALTDAVEAALRELGVNDFLPKPFDASALQSAVARRLPGAHS